MDSKKQKYQEGMGLFVINHSQMLKMRKINLMAKNFMGKNGWYNLAKEINQENKLLVDILGREEDLLQGNQSIYFPEDIIDREVDLEDLHHLIVEEEDIKDKDIKDKEDTGIVHHLMNEGEEGVQDHVQLAGDDIYTKKQLTQNNIQHQTYLASTFIDIVFYQITKLI